MLAKVRRIEELVRTQGDIQRTKLVQAMQRFMSSKELDQHLTTLCEAGVVATEKETAGQWWPAVNVVSGGG